MRNIRKSLAVLITVACIFSFCLSSFAVTKHVEELGINFNLPDTWIICTRTDFNPEYAKILRGTDSEEEWQRFMKLYNFYIYATVPGNSGQYEIYVSSYDDFNESIDYSDMYEFELNATAKASFNANNEQKGEHTYKSYASVKGESTNFIQFDYQGTDDSGNVTYGRLYHTVINGKSIDFDLNSYDSNFFSSEYLTVFDNAVKTITYDKESKTSVAWYELNERTKTNLTYISLIVLAIALIVVIIIFIISKNKEKQLQMNAEKERLAALEAANEEDEDELTDDEDLTYEELIMMDALDPDDDDE